MTAMADHVRAMLALQARRRGHLRLRQQHPRAGTEGRRHRRLRDPGLRAGVHPAAVLPRQGTVPLGGAVGRSGRHRGDRCAGARDVRRQRRARAAGSEWRRSVSPFQGLPARIFWLGYGERARFGLAINDLVRRGVVKAPIVIGRDHLDAGSVASPNRETENMRDGSDAIADWPILNALLEYVGRRDVGVGASRRRRRHRIFAPCRAWSSSPTAAARRTKNLQRVLTCDPGLGVVRHADAGYPEAH